jgi:LmbE family N-acetylglucosaminyl deacetylase
MTVKTEGLDTQNHQNGERSKRWLVIAPHADDEIFAIPYIAYAQKSGVAIDILFLGADPKRRREATKSCRHLKAKGIFGEDLGLAIEDGKYHEKILEIVDIIKNLSLKHEKILAPVVEGGHQDHDTAWLAVALTDAINKTNKGSYYQTYTARGRRGLFITCSAENQYTPDIFKKVWTTTKLMLVKRLFLAVSSYKSQYKTWTFLLAGLVIKWSSGEVRETILTCKGMDIYCLNKILYSLSGKACLYELHSRIQQSCWQKYALAATKSLIEMLGQEPSDSN